MVFHTQVIPDFCELNMMRVAIPRGLLDLALHIVDAEIEAAWILIVHLTNGKYEHGRTLEIKSNALDWAKQNLSCLQYSAFESPST